MAQLAYVQARSLNLPITYSNNCELSPLRMSLDHHDNKSHQSDQKELGFHFGMTFAQVGLKSRMDLYEFSFNTSVLGHKPVEN